MRFEKAIKINWDTTTLAELEMLMRILQDGFSAMQYGCTNLEEIEVYLDGDLKAIRVSYNG